MWTGYTLFHDHHLNDDDLRAPITEQLDDIEKAPVEKRVRIAPPSAPSPVVYRPSSSHMVVSSRGLRFTSVSFTSSVSGAPNTSTITPLPVPVTSRAA